MWLTPRARARAKPFLIAPHPSNPPFPLIRTPPPPQLLETYTNLGPIIDFCVVDPEGQGQGQVVTCSGTKADGSLRIVRNGVGIHEQASVELHGIKGVWSLRPAWDDAHDKFLVLTFVGETRVLAINPEDELDEAEIPGFDAAAQTLYCGNTRYGSQLVQVCLCGGGHIWVGVGRADAVLRQHVVRLCSWRRYVCVWIWGSRVGKRMGCCSASSRRVSARGCVRPTPCGLRQESTAQHLLPPPPSSPQPQVTTSGAQLVNGAKR